MADERKRFTELLAIDAVAGDDVLAVEDTSSGGTRRATVAQLSAALGAGSPTERFSFRDDFDSLDAWVISTSNGGEALHGATATALGFASSGVLALSCGTAAGSSASAARAQSALVPDAGTPAIVEWRVGVLPPDECQWILGMLAADDRVVALLCDWSGSAMVASLAIVAGGSPTLEPVTLPALGDGTGYRLRLTVTPAGAELEGAVDGGAYATLATLATSVSPGAYRPFVSIDREAHAGGQVIALDWCAGDGLRYAAGVGGDSHFDPVLPRLPATTGASTGDVLAVQADGGLAYEPPAGGLPDSSGASEGDVLTIASGSPAWAAPDELPPGLLWEWNGLDTTQFDSPVGYARFGGGGPSGSPTLSVVSAPYGGGNALRVAATSLTGGYFWPIIGLTLPGYYMVEAGWCRANTYTTGNPTLMLFASNSPVRGASFDFSFNSTVQYLGAIRSGTYADFPTLGTSMTAHVQAFNRGVRTAIYVARQTGANPATWRVHAPAAQGFSVTASIDGARSSIEDRASADNGDWDGVDMGLCGPGVYVGGGGPADISLDMTHLRIWSIR